MKKQHDFTQGPILPALLKFALPVLLALLLQAMYGAVDLQVVGNFGTAADISAVSTSQAVTITADGTGGRRYTGVIASVAPTSTDAAVGNADAGSSAMSSDTTSALSASGTTSVSSGSAATFQATVDLARPTDGLKIGMKTNQDITVENRQNVFTVPIDAVTKDANGRYEIFVVKSNKDAPKTVEAVVVETGLQNDTHIQITAEGLKAGAKVALNPASLEDGQQVQE